jgi:CspA family cold shock protein
VITGSICHVNAEKGFSFIKRDDSEPDVFCHSAALARSGIENVKIGDRVEFQVRESHKRPGRFEAVDIALID